jgi:K+-sensing histidine kinase KdpD
MGRLRERYIPQGIYLLDDRESAVAQWAFDHGRMAGKTTTTLPATGGL